MRVCPLCGLKFSEAEAKRPCKNCPLSRSCNLVCCPNCGYQTPEEPRWLVSLRHWWRNYKSPGAADVASQQTLAELKPGQVAEIIQVCPPDDATLRKLMALGLLPGSQLKLLRRFPCYLVQLGQAQLALDKRLAAIILVRTD